MSKSKKKSKITIGMAEFRTNTKQTTMLYQGGQMRQIFECVPNFSEGRDRKAIETIADAFKGQERVKLLDVQADQNHNRSVLTVIGEPEALMKAVIAAVETAVSLIDMRRHQGEHPRMGAVDVIPFVPIRGATMEDAVKLAQRTARDIAERLNLPVFLYEDAAARPERRNLAQIRSGQFEGMAEKLQLPEWRPDFGPACPHPTAGVTAVGARMPLIAYNINLGTANKAVANAIARKVRHINGGLRHVKAIGVELADRGAVQVSMNLTDYTQSSIATVFALVKAEAERYGVPVIGSEVVGIAPLAALIDAAAHYLRLENFSPEQILEYRLVE